MAKIREGRTVVSIAHRLSTIRDANRVVYISKGRIIALGTFEEMKKKVPEFNTQIINSMIN
jgi:ABC-type multidrug transport system fused ATPase/permease subunit